MSSYRLNAGMETLVPLNGIANNALLNTSPLHTIHQSDAASNRPHPVHFCLDSLMPPHLVVNWTVIGVVRRPQIWRDKCRSLALKEVERLARPVH